jgi:hypothetical protein
MRNRLVPPVPPAIPRAADHRLRQVDGGVIVVPMQLTMT